MVMVTSLFVGHGASADTCDQILNVERTNVANAGSSQPASNGADSTRFEGALVVPEVSDFSIGGARLRRPRCQGHYGSCWAHSRLGLLERRAKNHGVDIELSHEFIIYHDLREKMKNQFKRALAGLEYSAVRPGHFNYPAKDLFNRHGVIPSSEYVVLDTLKSPRVIDSINETLLRLADGMRDFSKYFSEIKENYDEASKIRADLDAMYRGMSARERDLKFDEYRELFTEIAYKQYEYKMAFGVALDDPFPESFLGSPKGEEFLDLIDALVDEILQSRVGLPPRSFIWNGESITPEEFLKLPMFQPSGTKTKTGVSPFGSSYKVIGKAHLFETDIIETIARGDELIVNIKWFFDFVDLSTGIYVLPETRRKPIWKHYRFGGHSMRIHDIILNSQGGVSWLLLENSHGEGPRSPSYLRMDWSTFSEVVQELEVTR
jgi:hypothetical protein